MYPFRPRAPPHPLMIWRHGAGAGILELCLPPRFHLKQQQRKIELTTMAPKSPVSTHAMMGTASRAVDTLSDTGCAPLASGSIALAPITPLATAHLWGAAGQAGEVPGRRGEQAADSRRGGSGEGPRVRRTGGRAGRAHAHHSGPCSTQSCTPSRPPHCMCLLPVTPTTRLLAAANLRKREANKR